MITNDKYVTRDLPILALRGITMFPDVFMAFNIERNQSHAALKAAESTDYDLFLVTQRDVSCDAPGQDDLYEYGVVCHITSLTKNSPNSSTASVEGLYRGRILRIYADEPCFFGRIEPVPDFPVAQPDEAATLMRACLDALKANEQLVEGANPMQMFNVMVAKEPGILSNRVAQALNLFYTDKQNLLEELDPVMRLEMLMDYIRQLSSVLVYEQELNAATNDQVNKSQREYYLREQMKVIQHELGEDGSEDEISEYRSKIKALKLDETSEAKLLKEVSHLAKQPFGSAEGSVIRNYLDLCLELPWNEKTVEQTDIAVARKQLDDDHFGLEKVKERIIEYLAVRQLAPNSDGAILCLVGPPGTGKTSIAMSVAKALNRKLVRISLGGVDDEAEIRGHRKTYVGSMPGRIIAGLNTAKSSNPLMVLDEIDKLNSSHRGDPASALLEVLDPEQNKNFRDNYLEIPFDLSNVFFIATANTTDTVPRALLDRMEVIRLSSYTDEEKLCIAKNYLVPKQRKKHGLKAAQLKISDDAIREIITLYTRESGVRELERCIASVCRKTVVLLSEGAKKSVSLRAGSLQQYLGSPKFKPEQLRRNDEVGLVRGLAWTAAGGEVLDVEAAIVPGTGKLELTGNLGDVMKESCHAALTYIRSRTAVLGIDPDFYKNYDIHLHFPEGAVPKDGPSAGITVTVAMVSALTGMPVRHDVAMTGEISLRGRVMPIGGLKEKTMAAMRNGVSTVIIPADNEADLDEIDPRVRAALNFICVDSADKALDAALIKPQKHTPDIVIPTQTASKRKVSHDFT